MGRGCLGFGSIGGGGHLGASHARSDASIVVGHGGSLYMHCLNAFLRGTTTPCRLGLALSHVYVVTCLLYELVCLLCSYLIASTVSRR